MSIREKFVHDVEILKVGADRVAQDHPGQKAADWVAGYQSALHDLSEHVVPMLEAAEQADLAAAISQAQPYEHTDAEKVALLEAEVNRLRTEADEARRVAAGRETTDGMTLAELVRSGWTEAEYREQLARARGVELDAENERMERLRAEAAKMWPRWHSEREHGLMAADSVMECPTCSKVNPYLKLE